MEAQTSTVIEAPKEDVWRALTTPRIIKEYMFGAEVVTDWRPGSPIKWKGEWEGKAYEDKGKIIRVEPAKRLTYTHFSPLAGLPDKPGNYHTVDIRLEPKGRGTLVVLTQDNNPDEEAQKHSEENWTLMLDGLKQVVET